MKTVPALWFEYCPWINGKWHHSLPPIEIRNPATFGGIASVSFADEACVLTAINGAVAAQKSWARTSAVERGMILKRIAELLLERKDAFARLLSAEQGKPYEQSIGEVEYAASFFQWFGEEARRVYGRITNHPDADREFLIQHKPAGQHQFPAH